MALVNFGRKGLFVIGLLVLSLNSAGAANWNQSENKEEGFIVSGGKGLSLNLKGYGQFLLSAISRDYDISNTRKDQPFGFSIRRARFDMNVSAYDNLDILVEIGTPSTPLRSQALGSGGASDIGIVEARGTTPVFGDALALRIGKFVVPFSGENSRSSRKLDTVERSTMVGSLIANNILDTQIGLMLFGRDSSAIFNYYLTLVNGNGDNLSTPTDGNAFKQFQAKIALKPHRNFYFAVSYDTDDVRDANYKLYDHAFVVAVAAPSITGRRNGIETDFDWSVDRFNWKTEVIYLWFPDSSTNKIQNWWGGYTQFGWFIDGDNTRGVQGILRGEYTLLQGGEANNKNFELASSVLGINGFINANLNLQVNYIMEFPNENLSREASTPTYGSRSVKHIGQAELQVKF